MDMSFMGKFLVQGRDAGKCLNWISANDVDGAPGQITYTQWLNREGRLEADLTVTKLGDDRFFVVVTDTMVRHAEAWMKRNIPDDAHAFVTDVTSGVAQLNVQGPRSRELLQSITSVDLSNEAFPFRAAREIDIGYARVLCVRITYVGELGYELYIPAEQAVHVYDQVVEAGARLRARARGAARARQPAHGKGLSRLRSRPRQHRRSVRDRPRVRGRPQEAGRLPRQGRAARAQGARPAEAAAGAGARARIPQPLMYHAEIVLRDGVPVGYVRAASYGHTLGGAVGLAMIEPKDVETVDAAYLDAGTLGGRDRRTAVSRRSCR